MTLSPKSLLPNLGVPREASRIQLHNTRVPLAFPNTVHMHPALQETQNPGLLSYFLGGNFDLQEFRLGPAPATGAWIGRRQSPGFLLWSQRRRKQPRLGGHSLHSKLPRFFQTRSPDVLFLPFLVFVLFIPHCRGPAPSHPYPIHRFWLKNALTQSGKHSQRAVPGVWGLERKRGIKTVVFTDFKCKQLQFSQKSH